MKKVTVILLMLCLLTFNTISASNGFEDSDALGLPMFFLLMFFVFGVIPLSTFILVIPLLKIDNTMHQVKHTFIIIILHVLLSFGVYITILNVPHIALTVITTVLVTLVEYTVSYYLTDRMYIKKYLILYTCINTLVLLSLLGLYIFMIPSI